MCVKCNLHIYSELQGCVFCQIAERKSRKLLVANEISLRLGRTSEGVHKVDAGKMQRLNVACARSFYKNRWGIHTEWRRGALRLECGKDIDDSDLLLVVVMLG